MAKSSTYIPQVVPIVHLLDRDYRNRTFNVLRRQELMSSLTPQKPAGTPITTLDWDGNQVVYGMWYPATPFSATLKVESYIEEFRVKTKMVLLDEKTDVLYPVCVDDFCEMLQNVDVINGRISADFKFVRKGSSSYGIALN